MGAIRPDLSWEPHARPDIVDISTQLHIYQSAVASAGRNISDWSWNWESPNCYFLSLTTLLTHILDLKYDLFIGYISCHHVKLGFFFLKRRLNETVIMI